MENIKTLNIKNVLNDIEKDILEVIKYNNENKNISDIKNEIKQIELTIKTLNNNGIKTPSELTNKLNDLKSKLNNNNMNEAQKHILNYIKCKYNLKIKTSNTKNRISGNINILYKDDTIETYKTFKAICEAFNIDPKKNSAKRALISHMDILKECNVLKIYTNDEVILEFK